MKFCREAESLRNIYLCNEKFLTLYFFEIYQYFGEVFTSFKSYGIMICGDALIFSAKYTTIYWRLLIQILQYIAEV